MALRTVPIAIEQARQVHRLAPDAWLINFTNPAGLITQAIAEHTAARVVGICDTPTEMLHRIGIALKAAPHEVHCEYLGLNHLGWVRKVTLRGKDVTEDLLANDALLSQLYSVPLFDHALMRALHLIPTEYLFFYYSRQRALANQLRQGSTRGAEVERLNGAFFQKLHPLLASGFVARMFTGLRSPLFKFRVSDSTECSGSGPGSSRCRQAACSHRQRQF